MHDCPQCGDACYCDQEDADMGEPDECFHECEETEYEHIDQFEDVQ